MAHFDEKSGIVDVKTSWGRWWQTVEEVFVEVNVEEGTRGKEIKVDFRTKSLKCAVRGKPVFEGKLFGPVVAEDCTWTVQDRKLLLIMLAKCSIVKEQNERFCWKSLFESECFTL